MPIKKLCPRCRVVIDAREKHCDRCEAFYLDRHKQYDSRFRNKKAKSFYNSNEWIKTREIILAQYNGLDIFQLIINNRVISANTVHHIEELNENWNKRLDIDNLIPVSHDTHMLIHSMYRSNKSHAQQVLMECKKKYSEIYGG